MRERSSRDGRRYAAIPNDAMRDSTISIEARGALALLMTYSDEWQFNREHLMVVIGCGKDRFGKIMGELIEAGYVKVVFTRDTSGRLLGKNWVIMDQKTVVRENRTMDHDPKEPSSDKTVVRGNRRPEDPPYKNTKVIRKPIDQENQDQSDLLSEEDAPKIDKVQDQFDRFWAEYPKKVSKKTALVRFKAAVKNGVDPEMIILAARSYASRQKDPQFIKYPDGWLNEGRWDQEPVSVQSGGAPPKKDWEIREEEIARKIREQNERLDQAERERAEREKRKDHIQKFVLGRPYDILKDNPAIRAWENATGRDITTFDPAKDSLGAV